MKYLFTFLLALCATFAFGQTETIDFETAGVGSDWAWTASDQNPEFTIINNPHKTGINTSDKVVEFIAKTTDKNWALAHSKGIGKFTFDATNNSVKIKVYKPTISDVAIKFEGTSSAKEIKVPNTLTNQWEELTFDFSSVNGNTYDKIVIIPDFVSSARAQNNTLYLDDIVAPNGAPTCSDGIKNGDETAIDCGGTSCSPCIVPPTTAAPTPPARAAADVISLYSDAYTDVASNFDAGWCGANSVKEITVAGNATMAYAGNACQGIVLNAGVDASTFTNYHVDIFIEAGTDLVGKVFNLKFVGTPTSVVKEVNHDLNALKPSVGKWVSLNGTVDLSTMGGFKEFGITSNLNNKVWYDNLYAYKGTPLSLEEKDNSISIYPNPFANHVEIQAAHEVSQVRVYNITGQEILRDTPNKARFTLDTAHLSKGVYLLSLESNGKNTTAKMVK